jgi:hypothetical protein
MRSARPMSLSVYSSASSASAASATAATTSNARNAPLSSSKLRSSFILVLRRAISCGSSLGTPKGLPYLGLDQIERKTHVAPLPSTQIGKFLAIPRAL